MKTLYVTRGSYAGRYMQVEDEHASRALSDGWARESDSQTPEELQQEEERRASGDFDEHPESLTEWEDSLGLEAEPDTDAETGEKRSRKSRSKKGS